MVRQIIHIDEEKCNGCGACATACHEGAIDMVDGKAKLMREHFCDGFGDCLPNCPTGAITFETREAPDYDEDAVKQAQLQKKMQEEMIQKEKKQAGVQQTNAHQAGAHQANTPQRGGCPGSRFMQLQRETAKEASVAPGAPVLTPSAPAFASAAPSFASAAPVAEPVSQLLQWPVQIKLLPTEAPFYNGAKLLIAADCTAYAYARFHEDFMKGKVTLIGCPKLDAVDYTEKLTAIIANNDIKSVTIVRMEVPCCGGLQRAAERALQNSGKFIPWQVVTIARDGRILD